MVRTDISIPARLIYGSLSKMKRKLGLVAKINRTVRGDHPHVIISVIMTEKERRRRRGGGGWEDGGGGSRSQLYSKRGRSGRKEKKDPIDH